ncbi:unnamed protein product [Strongylus vulgaris]|uniref:Reverse transcriptase domain-containing protein n=1 Tax=Strongylus vulgaris TaxID=40348 RepID=A0A3P7IWI9_STRVU|nr:unnamed protein product [Strongylus vulgaris]
MLKFSNLRFTDDIVLFSKSITEAETMLKELGSREADRTANQPEEDSVHEECLLRDVGKRIGFRINRKRTQFMKNAFCEDQEMELEGPVARLLTYISGVQ